MYLTSDEKESVVCFEQRPAKVFDNTFESEDYLPAGLSLFPSIEGSAKGKQVQTEG